MNDDEVDLVEEAGGESAVHVLKARDPSFFVTPWDPPDIEAAIDERPQTLMVATKQHLTPVQRVFIRIDATVRLNRIWKGRYDRFNGHHFIEALKEAAVYPVPRPESSKDGRGLLTLGEWEGEEGLEGEGEEEEGPEGSEGEEEEEEEEYKEVSDFPEYEGEYEGPDVIQKVLEALKFVQEKHNEKWMKKEVEKLCKEYHRKAQEIIETKQDWKARVVKLQMEWADQWTNYLLAMQNKFVEMKNKIEDHEMMKALELYESELQQVAADEVEEEVVESDESVPGVPNKFVKVEGKGINKRAQQRAESEEVDVSNLSPLERIKRFIVENQRKKEQEEKAAAARRLLEEEEEEEATLKTENYLLAAEEREEQDMGEEADYDSSVLKGDELWKAKYVPLKFKLKVDIGSRQSDSSPLELKHISMPVKTGILEDGTVIREVPLFVREPEDKPTKRQIEDNLATGIEMREEDPNANPFEWALKKTVHEFLDYHGRKRYNSRGMKNTKSSPRFARVGVLRTIGPRTEFIPSMRNFDAKTRAILTTGNHKEIRKLPLSVLKVTTLNGTPCSLETKASGFDEGHVTFRGVMCKFESKSLMRIFIEETMSPEEYRKRYKGRDWMKQKLAQLYDEFNAMKTEIITNGLEGRILTEKNLEAKSACPIFWEIANDLRQFFQVKEGEPNYSKLITFPFTIKSLENMFYNIIVLYRPEVCHNRLGLQTKLSKWGGLEMCHIDLESIVNLMWILSEMDEFKMCWEEIKDTVISSTTCPLCLLFNFIRDTVDHATARDISVDEGNQRKATVIKWHMSHEIKSLEEIAEEFKARERPIMNPDLFPDKNTFHILTTGDEKRKMNTNAYRLGQDRNSTRSFVMRSCQTVIFDISRSVKEIPWIWIYLKHHMELLDKKDVRDEADREPMRHLILITSFLSWAKSPPIVRTNISENTFHQRVPHPDYLDHYKVENTIHYIGVNYKQFKLRTTIIYTGIPFGEEEDVLIYLFKMAWDNELELPLFGNGRNVLPLIHITDLTWIVVKTVNERTYPSMIFAMNKNDQTLFAIASRIANAFGSSSVVKFPSPGFKMKFCIPKIIDDLLKQNVKYTNVDTPYNVRALWNNAFLKQKKLQTVINELREARKLYGKTVLLIGPPSKAKSELAIIISKLYNLPLIHKNNILNYYMRATQGREPQEGGEEEEEEEEAKAEDEEEEAEKEDEDEDEEKKAKKPIDPLAQEKRFAKQLKKLMDGKDKNKARKQLTKLLQKLLQSVFIQSHGYVLVDWPVRKEDTIALFTKVLEEAPPEEELIDEKPQAPPPPRPDIVIFVSAPDRYLDEKSYFLFQDLALKSVDEMQYDLLEYRYFRQLHQSVVDLMEERDNPIFRISNHDGIKVVGKLVCIVGEPQQASGRWIYEMFLQNEKACDEKVIEKGKKKEKEAKWLKKQYKHAVNRMLTARRRGNYSLREQLLGKPLDAFKDAERISSNLRRIVDPEYQEWRNMKDQVRLKKKGTNQLRVWEQVENRRWIATFEKMKEYWME